MSCAPAARDRSATDALVAAYLAKGGQITHCAPRAARTRTTRLAVAKRTTLPNGRTRTVLKRAGHASHTSFAPTIAFTDVKWLEAALPSLQRGQWVNLNGMRGRVVGQGASTWIAWGRAARDCKAFKRMCGAFAARGATAPAVPYSMVAA